MGILNSVAGPISTMNLGFTLMHEHVVVSAAGITRNYPELLGPNYMDRIVDCLKQAKSGGIDTIVEASTVDLGRDVKILNEASHLSGVNIIACTGWWTESPFFLTNISANQLAQVFIREIREGISGTNIKAGIIKAASDIAGVTKWQETILRGVARAHLSTNAPIMLHSHSPSRVGLRQLAILKEEGVNLRRVKVDHSNDTTDISYLTWILKQGCYLGMDRYPGQGISPHDRTKTLKALIDIGYADRLLLSHDCVLVELKGESDISIKRQKEREKANPYGYLYLKKVVFPELQEMGVSKSILNRLCTLNPQNFFDGN